jgi:poly(hydroxyalkanoate) depolymerase family esterase
MREAMRLMQTGDLLAATAAIQQQLGGGLESESPGAAESARDSIEAAFRVVDEIPPEQDAASGRFARRTLDPRGRGQFSEHQHTGAAGSRRYKLFVPSAYEGQPLPLVVMLHGCKQGPDDFATGTRMNILAEERRCFVAYPAQSQSANISKCWNWFKASDQRRGQGEPAIIAGIVDELSLTYGLDRERVYVAGLSAGAAMAVILGRTYPDMFAAVGVHSGLPYATAHDLPSAFTAMHRAGTALPRSEGPEGAQAWRGNVPTIVFHGDRDTTVHPSNGEQVASETAAVNADESSSESSAAAASRTGKVPGGYSYTCTTFKDDSERIVVEYWLVHGAAHAWFGGDPRGSYTDIQGPDASSEMLRFFLERARASDQ